MRLRVTALGVLSLSLPVLAVGGAIAVGAGPAQADIAKTPAQMSAAMDAMSAAMVAKSTSGWRVECESWSTEEGASSITMAAAPDKVAVMGVMPAGSLVPAIYHSASTTEWVTNIDIDHPYGITAANRSKVLLQAGLPDNTAFLSGPWKPWVSRYSIVDVVAGYPAMRQGILAAVGPVSVPVFYTEAGAVITFAAGRAKGGTWSASSTSGDTKRKQFVVIDPFGLLKSSSAIVESKGVVTQTFTCKTLNVGIPAAMPVLPTPVAPLKAIGPVAWKVSKTDLAVEIAKAVKATVQASGDVTESRVRGEASIELDKRGLKNSWSLTDIPGGTRLWITDPLGGTVQRCLKAKQGLVTISTCA